MLPLYHINMDRRAIWAVLTRRKGAVAAFEARCAEKFGRAGGVMFPNAEMAFYALFRHWGLENVEILCPAYARESAAAAIVRSGNVPVFVDCAKRKFHMDPDKAAAAIGPKTRAIALGHLFGFPMDPTPVEAAARDAERRFGHKIYFIQDVTDAFGCQVGGAPVSARGDAAVLETRPGAVFGVFSSGLALLPTAEGQTRLARFRDAMTRQTTADSAVSALTLAMTWKCFEKIGAANVAAKAAAALSKTQHDGAMELDAAIGLATLPRYDDAIRERRKNARRWIDVIGHRPDIGFPPYDPNATYSHCPAWTPDRDTWIARFRQKKVELSAELDYALPYRDEYARFRRAECPLALMNSRGVLQFPVWPGAEILCDWNL